MRRHGHVPRLLLILADAIAALAAAGLAYVIRFRLGWIPVEGRLDVLPARYLSAVPITVVLMLLAASLMGAYGDRALGRPTSLRTAVRVTAVGGALLATTALLYRDIFQYSRLAIVFTAVLYLPAFAAGRALAGRALTALRRSGRFLRRAAVVGSGSPARALAAALRAEPWTAVEIRAVLPLGGDPVDWPSARRLRDAEALFEAATAGDVDEVYLAVPATEAAAVPALVERLEQTTLDVRVVPDLGVPVLVNPHAFVLAGVPVVSLRERPLYGARAATKRGLDVVVASTLLLLLAPLLLVVGLLVRATSPGPALFGQERMGLDGRRFRMWKFRTMRLDAEADSGPVFARPGDPRVTGVGRFLRRFSVDELPQLWNVLRGAMRLVGPRPERATFVAQFRKSFSGYMLRHSVRTGMTGWAQVHGLRGESALDERLRLDLEYVDRWSLLLDLEILCRTVVQVLVGKNAC